jgi:phospholipase C
MGIVAALTLPVVGPVAASASPGSAGQSGSTPIRHVVVIFDENISFDHYFGTYPGVNGLNSAAPGGGTLLTNNPNSANPRLLNPNNINDLLTCDQNHNYTDEQTAFDNGAMDKFISTLGNGGTSATGASCNRSDVMNYYDGSTLGALWGYAHSYALNDNSYGTTFGPSSPGAINLVAGDTGGVDPSKEIRTVSKDQPNADVVTGGDGTDTLTNDAQPYYDDCSTRDSVALTGQNVGDLLNARGLSWGWFEGGITPSVAYSGPGTPAGSYNPLSVIGRAKCSTTHPIGAALGGTGTSGAHPWGVKADYIPHHEPFQYYASTGNPHHLPPASLGVVGRDTQSYTGGKPNFDTANHNYDLSVFDQLVSGISSGQLGASALPAVSFLKAAGYQDGHAGYSDPIDEQAFITHQISALQQTPDWNTTAVILAYDDSDGWYDHAYSGVTNPSASAADNLTGPGLCGTETNMNAPLASEQGRCGYGPRMPLLVISPFSKTGYVDHTLTNQASILRFIEDNWGLGRIAGSADAGSGTLASMFDFQNHQ